jgi:hypothetical protein
MMQVHKTPPIWLSAAVIAISLLGCATTGTPTWNPGAPDAETVEHYTLAMKAVDEKDQNAAQAAFYLLRSDVMRMHTNVYSVQAALAVLYKVSNAIDKEDWATARNGALALQATYGRR